jgi:hypothetical protein
MKNKYILKYEKEVDEIINPIHYHWKEFTESELEVLIKKFGNICRDETSVFKKEILSDNNLVEILLEIANTYEHNNRILIEIVSSINNMHVRYDLKITNSVFQFLIDQTKNKKVNFYVSIFISRVPQFNNYKYKWKYIMSVPNIAPKNKSRTTFYHIINDNINAVPNELKNEIIMIFENYIENLKLHPYTISQYSAIIEKLKESHWENVMDNIKNKIDNLFKELGFEFRNINGNIYYFMNNYYYKMTYLKKINSFVIEYAGSYNEACNNLFEDGDIYPLSSEEEFLKNLHKDLINYI